MAANETERKRLNAVRREIVNILESPHCGRCFIPGPCATRVGPTSAGFNKKIDNEIVDNLVVIYTIVDMDTIATALPAKGPTGLEIADWIRSQIRAARFVPGQRLVEVDIIRQTGGSRFNVREALQRVAAEGLVEIQAFRGARARGAAMAEVRQLYRARAA